MNEMPTKVEIARKNWYETDCKGLSVSVIKDAYERGFNRAYRLMKPKDKEPSKVIHIHEVEEGFSGNCSKCGALLDGFYNSGWCGTCGEKVKWK